MNFRAAVANQWVRRGVWAAGALLLVWALAWLAVPPIAKSQLEKRAGEALGRKVTVGGIDFRPWTLELTVRQLRIAAAAGGVDGGADALSIDRIYIDGELQSLLRMAPVVDAIQIENPVIRVRHLGGGRYDFDDILQHLAARQQPAPANAEPARFALYNVALTGGAVDFRDDAVGKTHILRELLLGIPFLSNLPSQRDVKVAPHLAFVLNGSRFDSQAEATPFAQTRKTDATLRLGGLNLEPYLGYLPASLPVRLQSATMDAEIHVGFEQNPAIAVKLTGSVQARGVKVVDRQGAPLLDFDALRIGLDDVRPLERSVRLGEVVLEGPRLDVRRNSAGQINLLQLAQPAAPPVAARPAAAASSAAVPAPPAPAWAVTVAQLRVTGAKVGWEDATLRPPARLELADATIGATAISWPLDKPVPFDASATFAGGKLAVKGSATDQAANVDVQLADLQLKAVAPYLAQFLEPSVAGALNLQAAVQWTPQSLKLNVQDATLEGLAVTEGKVLVAGASKLQVAHAQVDLQGQTVSLGRVSVVQPRAQVDRDADGRWMFERWQKAQPAATAAATPALQGRPWRVKVADFSVDGGAVSYADRSMPRPVVLEVSALKVQARNFAPDSDKAGPLSVSARVGARRGDPGRLDFKGTLAVQPLAVQGRLDAESIPTHAFAAYVQQVLNVELLRAEASFRGQVRYARTAAGPVLKVSGDTALEDFRANTVPGTAAAGETARLNISEELLSWKALSLRGLDVSMAPGTATAVNVRETALADFYARVTVSENGRINLQDLVRHSEAAAPSAPAPAPVTGSTPAVINFGPISLVNGKVLFSDRFVRPNYSADLSELTGRLGSFSSVPAADGAPAMAELELRGRAEGTASLEITGKLNPVAQPLALDIKGKVRDLELAPLSPYSVKYAGHGIERGKLSMDVAYRVQPDGRLTASNNLVLNQLTFGEPVPGAPASLPVKLAVALLADRNGVIDINLPISGSLNDPQFSIGPIIFKVIVNLVVKAITSPFSLLASAFGGGGDELSAIAFPPGSAVLDSGARDNLDKVAKALVDRPALKMTVAGTASLEAERDGYRHERLHQLVAAEKRRAGVLGGQGAAQAGGVTADEYPVLLKAVYRRADIPKPRNLVGMAKDLPVPDMEALLLASIPVAPDDVRALAVQRGLAVKDYLATKQVAPERLFLGAPKEEAKPDSAWKPHAELSLATR